MVDFCDRVYKKMSEKKFTFSTPLLFFTRIFVNIILPIYFIITCGNKKNKIIQTKKNKERYIVTFTSYPARINRLWLVAETILHQKVKPDLFILWLSKDQFPGLENVPKNLTRLIRRGLEIRLVDENILSHKKYFYSLQKFPNDHLITIDDDIFYPSNMIKELIDNHKKNPNSIICRYAHKIERKGKCLLPYKEWSALELGITKNNDVFFGSGGGTLFPANSLHPEVLNKEIFFSLCKYADDIWLNAMCRLNKTPITPLHNKCSLLPVLNRNRGKLCNTNVNGGENDMQLKKVIEYYYFLYKVDLFL